MSSLERYTKSIEPMLLSVENGNALAAVEAIIAEAQAGALTKTNAEYIRSIKMTLRRIVSARKELALHANGLKVALKTLTKLNGSVK
jgi:hypothetical protein